MGLRGRRIRSSRRTERARKRTERHQVNNKVSRSGMVDGGGWRVESAQNGKVIIIIIIIIGGRRGRERWKEQEFVGLIPFVIRNAVKVWCAKVFLWTPCYFIKSYPYVRKDKLCTWRYAVLFWMFENTSGIHSVCLSQIKLRLWGQWHLSSARTHNIRVGTSRAAENDLALIPRRPAEVNKNFRKLFCLPEIPGHSQAGR